MALQRTINRNYSVVNGEVIITEHTEKTLNRSELEAEKLQLLARQNQVLKQISELKRQYAQLTEATQDLEHMIDALKENETDIENV